MGKNKIGFLSVSIFLVLLLASCSTTMYQYYDQDVDEEGNPIEWSEEDLAMKEKTLEEVFLFEDFEDGEILPPLRVGANAEVKDGVLWLANGEDEIGLAIDDPDIDFKEIILCAKVGLGDAQLFMTTRFEDFEPHYFLRGGKPSATVFSETKGMQNLGEADGKGKFWALMSWKIEDGKLQYLRNGEVFATFEGSVPEFLESAFISYAGDGRGYIDYIILKGVRVTNSPEPETEPDMGM